jgi:hypothetical protein
MHEPVARPPQITRLSTVNATVAICRPVEVDMPRAALFLVASVLITMVAGIAPSGDNSCMSNHELRSDFDIMCV